MTSEELIFNNPSLKAILIPWVSNGSIDDTLEKMYPFHNSFKIKDTGQIPSDQIIIVKNPNNSQLLIKKSQQQINEDLNTYFNDKFRKKYKKQLDLFLQDKKLDQEFVQIFESQIKEINQKKLKISQQNLAQNKKADLDEMWSIPAFVEHRIKTEKEKEIVKQIFHNEFCMYNIQQLFPKDCMGSVVNLKEDKMLLVFDPIEVVGFQSKQIIHLFQEKINEIKEKTRVFKKLFNVEEGYGLKTFLKKVQMSTYEHKKFVYQIGFPVRNVFVLGQGEVMLSKKNKKQEKSITQIMTAGSVFGNNDMNNLIRTEDAQSIGDTIIYQIDKMVFQDFIDHYCESFEKLLDQKKDFHKYLQDNAQFVEKKYKQVHKEQHLSQQQISEKIDDVTQSILNKQIQLRKTLKFDMGSNVNLLDLGHSWQKETKQHQRNCLRQIQNAIQRKHGKKIIEQSCGIIKHNDRVDSYIKNNSFNMSAEVQQLLESHISEKKSQNFSISRPTTAQAKFPVSRCQTARTRVNPAFDKTINSLCQIYTGDERASIQEYKRIKSQLKSMNIHNMKQKSVKVFQNTGHNAFRLVKKEDLATKRSSLFSARI